jgi:hypothetical protein
MRSMKLMEFIRDPIKGTHEKKGNESKIEKIFMHEIYYFCVSYYSMYMHDM